MPGGVDGGVEVGVRVAVHAVEVDAALVGAVVAAHHAVGVEHGHQLEHEQVPQLGGPRVLGGDERQEAREHEAGRRLAGVDTRRHEHHLRGKQR